MKKLEKLLDKAISVLADNDDKKNQERYINLKNLVQETRDYLEKGISNEEVEKELIHDLKYYISKFNDSKKIFIIFMMLLCALLFLLIFYVTYSYFYDYFYNGGHIVPPRTTKTTSKTNHSDKPDKTSKTSAKTSTTKRTTTSTTQVIMPPDSGEEETGFVTVIFDNTNLIDLENLYPVSDEEGLISTPITWKLDSVLSSGSKDYVITYTISFVDLINDISNVELLDITKLKYQLITKKGNKIDYDSGVQLLEDYPEVENGIRTILTGQTYTNDDVVDFELRMWLDSSTDNSQQGKKYRFNIDVDATYEFLD